MIVAIDASTSILGLAARYGTHLHLQPIHVLKERNGQLGRTAVERFWPALANLQLCEAITLIAVEKPPEHWKDDGSGRAKNQPIVNYQLGRASGVFCEAWAYQHGVPLRIVPNGSWRSWATGWARTLPELQDASTGQPARPVNPFANRPTARQPQRSPTGKGWVITFEGCEHTWTATDFLKLQNRPSHCPTCRSAPATGADDTMAHKRPFVEMAMRAWPAEVGRVVAAARENADLPNQLPHQLSGVADACDAALMLQYVISNPEESRP